MEMMLFISKFGERNKTDYFVAVTNMSALSRLSKISHNNNVIITIKRIVRFQGRAAIRGADKKFQLSLDFIFNYVSTCGFVHMGASADGDQRRWVP